MAVKPGRVRRRLFLAILVLMTLLPLVVYLYLRERGKEVASQRLVAHVEQIVNLALQLKNQLEATLEDAEASSQTVARKMESLALADPTIAYIQLANRHGEVLSSTSGAPERAHVALLVDHLHVGSPELSAPVMIRRLDSAPKQLAPEFVVDLRLAPQARGHLLVGLSADALDKELTEFQRPARVSALQISMICVCILAVFSAYIFYLTERARVLHAQLQEESRMAYIGTLASSIAHEVRNPLSSVKMNAQMLENRLERLAGHDDLEYFHNKITRIRGEVDRLEDSISHFLAFARPTPLRLEPVALNDVVGGVLELLEPQCQSRGVRIVRRFARGLPPARLDPRQFAQAVQNLVLNALQALGAGGVITVATEADNRSVAVTVADDGPGIPAEIQDKVFDVFFTTRDGGTGLGLNIVSRIVEEHRGKLSVDSQPGHGAAFRIELPLPPDRPDG